MSMKSHQMKINIVNSLGSRHSTPMPKFCDRFEAFILKYDLIL